MTEEDMRKELVRHVLDSYGTFANAARDWDCGTSYLCDVTKGRKPIPEWMLNKIGYARKIVRIK